MKSDPPDVESYGRSSNGSKMSTLRKKETNFMKLLWHASVYVIVDTLKFANAKTLEEKYDAIVYFGYTSEILPHERRGLHREKFPEGQYEMIVVKTWKFGEVKHWFGIEGGEATIAEFVMERLAAKLNFGSTNKAGGMNKPVDDFFRVIATEPGRENQMKDFLDHALTVGKFVTIQEYRCPDKSCNYRNKQKDLLVDHIQTVHNVFIHLYWCKHCETPQSFETTAERKHHYYMGHRKVQEIFWCLKCTVPHSFDSYAEVQAHRKSLQKEFWCFKCTIPHYFDSSADVQAHRVSIQEKFWCRKCSPNHYFDSHAKVQAHQKSLQKEFWCRKCTIPHYFDSYEEVQAHRVSIQEKFWCRKCTIPHYFDSEANVQAHWFSIRTEFWCRKCTPNHVFDSHAKVQAHRRTLAKQNKNR